MTQGLSHILVIDGYSAAGRAALVTSGGTAAGKLYVNRLTNYLPSRQITLVEMGSPKAVDCPIADFDGIVWTGSNLTIHKPDDLVRQEIELARAAFAAGIPQFGSCWAIQLAAVAAGGACIANPKGREFGAVTVRLTAAGRDHQLLAARPESYQVFTCHSDMVSTLPAGATLLATNEFAPIQAAEFRYLNGTFWAVQYHPEYDGGEIAALGKLRSEDLLARDFFADETEVEPYVQAAAALKEEPHNMKLARELGWQDSVLQPHLRETDIKNWLQAQLGVNLSDRAA